MLWFIISTLGAFVRRQWLWVMDWDQWRFEECERGIHDGVITGEAGYYTTHCKFCSWSQKFESWGE